MQTVLYITQQTHFYNHDQSRKVHRYSQSQRRTNPHHKRGESAENPVLVEIEDKDTLYRRFIISPQYIKENGDISSFAFTKKNKDERGLSFDLKRLTNIESSIKDKTRFRLCQLSAGFIRSIDLDCFHDPKPDNYAHVLLLCEGSISKSKKRHLAREASKPENAFT